MAIPTLVPDLIPEPPLQHALIQRLAGALTGADLRLSDEKLPAGTDRELLALTLDRVEGALASLEAAADKARTVQRDADLNEGAKTRKIAELLVPVATSARATFTAEVERFRDYAERMRKALFNLAKEGQKADPVAFEVRCQRIAGELGPLADGAIVRLIHETSAQGDRGPLDAVLHSYTLRPRVPAEVITNAEQAWARAVDPDVAARLEQAGRLTEAAERVVAVAANSGGRRLLAGLNCMEALAALTGPPAPGPSPVAAVA